MGASGSQGLGLWFWDGCRLTHSEVKGESLDADLQEFQQPASGAECSAQLKVYRIMVLSCSGHMFLHLRVCARHLCAFWLNSSLPFCSDVVSSMLGFSHSLAIGFGIRGFNADWLD